MTATARAPRRWDGNQTPDVATAMHAHDPDRRFDDWREKGCRCNEHNGSEAHTGWNPDAACGCIE